MKPSTPIIRLALAVTFVVCAGSGYGALTNEPAATTLSSCDVVFLLDNSGSMKTGGSSATIKTLTSGVLEGLSDGSRAGLIVFSNRLDVVLPLRPAKEEDTRKSIDGALDRLDYAGVYSNIPAALERAIYELRANRREDAQRLVAFISDGNIDSGRPADDARKQAWMVGELADEVRELGIRIYSFSSTEEANYELLQVLSHKTEGEYFRVLTPDDVRKACDHFRETFAKLAPAADQGNRPEPAPSTPEPTADDQGAAASLVQPVSGENGSEPKPNPAPDDAEESVAQQIPSEPKVSEAGSTTGPGAPATIPQGDSALAKAPEAAKSDPGSGQGKTEDWGKSGVGASTQPETGAEPAPEELAGGEPDPDASKEQPAPAEASSGVALGSRWFKLAVVAGAGLSGLVALLMALRLVMRSKDAVAASGPLAEPGPIGWIPEAFLVDLDNVTSALQHPLERPVTHIGRSERNHVRIADSGQTVSSLHATVECRSNGFFIVDRDSMNGTYLNGERLAKYAPVPIKPGEIIVVAKQFRFKLDMPGIEDRGGTVAIQTGNTSRVN